MKKKFSFDLPWFDFFSYICIVITETSSNINIMKPNHNYRLSALLLALAFSQAALPAQPITPYQHVKVCDGGGLDPVTYTSGSFAGKVTPFPVQRDCFQ